MQRIKYQLNRCASEAFRRILRLLNQSSLFIGFKYVTMFRKRRDRVTDCANYQPLPWIGLGKSRRTDGTILRWQAMDEYIERESSVLDVGANVGYFVFKAAEKGCMALGIDSSCECLLVANYAREKTKLYNAHFFCSSINPENVNLLPRFDYVIFLSVFHHWCAEYGFERSRDALATLIAKSERALFFEMGQAEMSPRYNIPSMGDDPRQWIADLLTQTGERQTRCLGQFEVFVDKGATRAERYLFCVGQA